MVWIDLEAKYLHQNASVVSEREFQTWIMKYARVNDWLAYHTENSMRSPAGFPDCVFVRPPEIVFAELKSGLVSANVKPAQEEWLRNLAACELEVHLWTPRDIPEIQTRLRRPL